MEIYIADSNFFIQAHRLYYPLDVVPSFWQKVKTLADNGKLISIDKVGNEILKNDDALSDWCNENLPGKFFADTQEVIAEYIKIVGWANSRSTHFTPSALSEFLDADEADAWLVAYALADSANRIIVTHEVSQPQRKNKIKIPDACLPFRLQFVDTIGMFRSLGVTF